MHKLEFADYGPVQPVFQAMHIHGAVSAVLGGRVDGAVYVDDRKQPTAALLRVEHRLYLSGAPLPRERSAALGRFFRDVALPLARDSGVRMVVLYYAPDGWAPALNEALADVLPIADTRHYYTARRESWSCRDKESRSQAPLPPGYTLRAIDRALLAETGLEHYGDLCAEMGSEHPTVDGFLEQSFGVCVVRGNELAGWCLAEYPGGARCEVGIETVPAHRERGLGTAMAAALIERAFARGIIEVGWHCYARNEASIATALKAGLTLAAAYPVYLGFYDE
jgi:RimJ/RimL family protein N-acetyltransferase